MLAGVLELQILTDIARLSTDMRRAEEQVKNSTDKMGRSVATLESAFGKLGSTLALGAVFEGVRRLSDDYTKLTAQIRIATHSQAEYAAGLAEVRRISTESQASITATGALYTRLTNSLGAYGATQKQVANITETVSLGLKAYGATSVEAASAMLQLSQAFASNRLGGDEFRAMMESMPNMMRTLATSMGVPFEALKVLSAEGKITAKEMMKAWDDPALIASLLKQADMTRTITGEITVLRNNIMMLVGELMQTSNGTQGITAVLHAMSDAVLMLAKHIQGLAVGAQIMIALFAGKWLLSKQMAIRASVAFTEATAMEVASEAARAKVAVAASEQIAAAKQLEVYAAREAFIATQVAAEKTLSIFVLSTEARIAAETRLAALTATVTEAEVAAIAVERELALTRAASTAAAEARAAAEIGALVKVLNFVKGMVGGTLGLIGLALWGAYEIADHLGWIDKVFNRAKSNMDALKGLAGDSPIFAKAFKYMEDEMAKYEANIKRVAAMKNLGVTVSVNATPTEMIAAIDKALKDLDRAIIWGQTNRLEAAMQLKLLRKGLEEPIVPAIAVVAKQVDHDLLFVTKRYNELLAQFEKGDIVQWQLTEGIKKMYAELSPNAEKASSEVTSWNKRLAEQAAALAGVAEEGRKLTKSETEYNDLIIALNTTKDAQLRLDGEQLLADAQSNVQKEAAINLTAEEVKAAEKKAEVMRQINAHGITQIDTLDKEIAAQKLHNDSIGKSAEQIANLKTEAEALLIVKLENDAADLSSEATSSAVAATKLANIQAEIAKMKELRDLKAAAAPLEAAKKLADEEKKAQEKLWHDIDGFAHTAFDNIFDKGKNVFEEIGKVIKKSILDMLYQMTIKKWVFQISGTAAGGSVSGLTGAADMVGGGSGGGLSGLLSLGQSIFSGGTSATAAASAAATAGDLSGVVAASGQGIGTAIASYVPQIAAAVAVYSIGKSLGVFGPGMSTYAQTTGYRATGQFGPSGVSGAAYSLAANGGEKYQDYAGNLGGGMWGANEAQKAFEAIRASVAKSATLLGVQDAASKLANSSAPFDVSVGVGGDMTKAIQQAAVDATGTLAEQLIPNLKDYAQANETLTQTFVRLAEEQRIVDSGIKALGMTLGVTGLAAADTRSQLVLAAGSLTSLTSKMDFFYQNFFTDSERRSTQMAVLSATFAQLGMSSIPQTNSQFKALVQAQDLTTVAGRSMFSALLDIAPAFDQVTKLTNTLNGSLTNLGTDLFASKIEYDRLMGRIGAGSATSPTTNAELLEELKAMRLELAALRDASNATATNTKRTADTLRNVSQDGTAFTTVPA